MCNYVQYWCKDDLFLLFMMGITECRAQRLSAVHDRQFLGVDLEDDEMDHEVLRVSPWLIQHETE